MRCAVLAAIAVTGAAAAAFNLLKRYLIQSYGDPLKAILLRLGGREIASISGYAFPKPHEILGCNRNYLLSPRPHQVDPEVA